MSAPGGPPERRGRSRTAEVSIVCATAAFVALLIYAPGYAFWAFIILLFALT